MTGQPVGVSIRDVRFRYPEMEMLFECRHSAGGDHRRHGRQRLRQVDIARSHRRIRDAATRAAS